MKDSARPRGRHGLRWGAMLAVGDLVGLLPAVVVWGWLTEPAWSAGWGWTAAAFWGLWLLIGGLRGVYSRWGMTPAVELALLCEVSGIMVLAGLLGMLGCELTGRPADGGWVLLGLWALAGVPVSRGVVRRVMVKMFGWGVPTVVIGTGKQAESLSLACREAWSLGLQVVKRVEDSPREGLVLVAADDMAAAELDERVVALQAAAGDVWVAKGSGEVGWLWDSCDRVWWGRDGVPRGGQRVARMIMAAGEWALAAAGCVICVPVAAVLAVAIKVESGGPLLFRQVRVGQGGKWFVTYKFRTMQEDAETRLEEILRRDPELRQEYGTYRKLQRDPRVTRVGRLLRRLSLDELPQLWNVLRGDMALVGPRAYLPVEAEQIEAAAREEVLAVRPGLTGVWQVHGRSRVSFEGRVRLDRYYVRNWSPWLDLYLLARTVWVVLAGRGAC